MGGLTMSTLAASTEHADKLGDPEWVTAFAATIAGISVGIMKGVDRVRDRRRGALELADVALNVTEKTVKLAEEMADRAVAQIRSELDVALADMAELRVGFDALTRENAELRSEVTLLRAGQPYDRRQRQ